MASVNTGNQLITFRYQQEGTAEGFNKLLCGVLPEGVISGGNLIRVGGATSNTIQVDTMQLLIGDGNIIVHAETRESFTMSVDNQKPFIVASFNWSQSANNFVSFEAKSLTEINSMNHPIILGRAVFQGGNLSSEFDYTRKTWCPSSKYNDYYYSSNNSSVPSFNVTPIENRTSEFGFVVGKGKAIINGVLVEKNNEETIILTENDSNYHKITLGITSGNARIDIAVLMNDGSVRYIMGDEATSGSAHAPNYPSNGLVIAEFKYTKSITPSFGIMGNNITNIYNNNYMGFSPQVGEKKGTTVVNPHTLYM